MDASVCSLPSSPAQFKFQGCELGHPGSLRAAIRANLEVSVCVCVSVCVSVSCVWVCVPVCLCVSACVFVCLHPACPCPKKRLFDESSIYTSETRVCSDRKCILFLCCTSSRWQVRTIGRTERDLNVPRGIVAPAVTHYLGSVPSLATKKKKKKKKLGINKKSKLK